MGIYIEHNQIKFQVGDTLKVFQRIKEGKKERTQVFEGLVIKIRGHEGSKSFTIRKISSGIGVEKIFQIDSPIIENIEVTRPGMVRRAKLYFLRDRTGRSALKVLQRRDNVEVSKKVAKKKADAKKIASKKPEIKKEAEPKAETRKEGGTKSSKETNE